MKENIDLIVIYYVTIINKNNNKNMLNKKQIITYFLVLGFVANSTFAFNLEMENKINKALGKDSNVKTLIKEEVEKQVKEEVKAIKAGLVKEAKLEEKKEVKIFTPREIFFANIKKASTEEERKEIFSKFKEKLQEAKTKKTEIIESKSKVIFDKFDLIISKLDLVEDDIQKNINSLEEQGLDLSGVKEKKEELNAHLDLAKIEKAAAWIGMQEINFGDEKTLVLESLKEVKEHLLISKEEIKKTSLNSKEIIFFIRGALANIKK